jgi:iron complex outermembrane receptor protein
MIFIPLILNLRIFAFKTFLLYPALLFSQYSSLTISIKDPSGEALFGAEVLLTPGKHVAVADANGIAVFDKIPNGPYVVEVNFLGYEKHRSETVVPFKGVYPVVMLPRLMSLQEVRVTAQAAQLGKPSLVLPSEAVGQLFMHKFYGGSLASTLERLPGVNSLRIGMGQSKPMIRGMAFGRLLVIDDGMRHEGQQWGEEHGLEADALAAAKVEVIRGPASVRYGSDAIGGVLSIASAENRHSDGVSANLTLHAASVNKLIGGHALWQLKSKHQTAYAGIGWWDAADYKVPSDSVDVFNFRLPIRNGILRNTAGMERSFKAGYGFARGAWHHQARMSVINSRQGFFAHAHGLEPRNVDTLFHDRSQRDVQYPMHEIMHLKLIHQSQLKTEKGSLTWLLGYQKNLMQEQSPYVNHGFMPPQLPETMLHLASVERFFDKDALAFELVLEQESQRSNWKTGISADAIQNRIDGWAFEFPEYRSRRAGIFGIVDIKHAVGHTFQAGMRLDAASIHIDEYRDWFAAPDGQHMLRSENLTNHSISMTWSAGYSLNKGRWTISTNAGKSFRLPTAAELGANGVNYHQFRFEQGNPNLNPEISYQLDASAEWKNSRLAIEISPFVAWSPNYIYLNPTSQHDYLYGNGNQKFEYTQSQVVRAGGELHLHYLLTDDLILGVIAEGLYARQLSGPKKGYALPLSPPQSLLLNLNWTPNPTRPLELSADLRLTSAQNRVVPPEQKTPAWYTINIHVNNSFVLGRQSFDLSLQLNNITNSVYLNHLSYYRRINLPEAGRNLVLVIKIPIVNNLNFNVL